jgi:sugar/nucleoside kinase (ribokinase family)
VIVVSGLLGETDRTIFWQQGARLRMGDPLPINEFFEHELVILDVDDERLRRFVVDLPLHVSPRTRILGTLTYLPELPPRDALDVALRYNYLVGNERELRYVTRTDATDQALSSLRARMPGADLRLAAISLGARGCVLMTLDETIYVPGFQVDVVDTTGAGDAFAAGVALGIINNRPLEQIGQIGNALGALSIRALGARAGLPSRDELIAFLGDDSAFVSAEP